MAGGVFYYRLPIPWCAFSFVPSPHLGPTSSGNVLPPFPRLQSIRFFIRAHPRKSAVSFCLSDFGNHSITSLFLCVLCGEKVLFDFPALPPCFSVPSVVKGLDFSDQCYPRKSAVRFCLLISLAPFASFAVKSSPIFLRVLCG